MAIKHEIETPKGVITIWETMGAYGRSLESEILVPEFPNHRIKLGTMKRSSGKVSTVARWIKIEGNMETFAHGYKCIYFDETVPRATSRAMLVLHTNGHQAALDKVPEFVTWAQAEGLKCN